LTEIVESITKTRTNLAGVQPMKTNPKSSQPGTRDSDANALIIVQLQQRRNALKASELATLLGVTPQHVYKMAAQQDIPSFRVGKSVRFDPRQVAEWLRRKMPQPIHQVAEISIAV
jgi:excisionase family DNA binding protein